MGYVFLLAAILAENTGKIVHKFYFNVTGINPRESLRLGFAFMTAFIAMFIVATRPDLPELSTAIAVPLYLVVIFSFLSNVFDEKSLKVNPLSLREPVSNFRPILTGFIGYLLFPEEREIFLLVALVVGALIVFWGIKPNHLRKIQRAGLVYMLVTVLAESALSNTYVYALENVRPEYIALVRTIGISILLFILYPPKKRNYKNKKFSRKLVMASSSAYATGAIVNLYAIETLGIVTTMLLHLFSPALRYASAFIFLKDRPTQSEVVSSTLLGITAITVTLV